MRLSNLPLFKPVNIRSCLCFVYFHKPAFIDKAHLSCFGNLLVEDLEPVIQYSGCNYRRCRLCNAGGPRTQWAQADLGFPKIFSSPVGDTSIVTIID